MSATLFRYVVRTYLGFAVGILCALVTVFLVVDFVDRSRMYTGEGWVWSVVVLYANKALLCVQQLGPAALLLAAGAAVSSLRKRGEVTAMRALSFGPKALYLPVGVCVALACVGLIAFDEWVVVQAGIRVDEITTQRFNRWGDWGMYHTPKQWFRRGDHIFYLRSGSAQEGFVDVAILTVTPDFRLARRVDARSMRPVEGTRWKLEGVVERTFTRDGQSSVRELDEVEYDLGASARTFRIRPGRPEQMRVPVLREQITARGEVGLATRQFSLVLHNRFAYPLAGLPAALLAVGLALRPGRKGNLTVALVEGLLISVIMWGLMVVARTLVLSERLSPVLAAWFPVALLVVAAALLWLRGEGRLGRGGG
ncbi:LptF/LptG family permease [Cystobacter ferrugineus]|uniref:Permease YjgP/YjgQ family protein n=1 Tax=Cystobacter ferrugineus TaxID=83449 RepID=A0A1L9BC82_9BACT|nr:LptF/LptG family permease [Cystobacter ferrugineus]OJH39870.1 permease YjgP/YjgQ family protein [Cystobacter ferrugineus]